jgi:hypothetical protein
LLRDIADQPVLLQPALRAFEVVDGVFAHALLCAVACEVRGWVEVYGMKKSAVSFSRAANVTFKESLPEAIIGRT